MPSTRKYPEPAPPTVAKENNRLGLEQHATSYRSVRPNVRITKPTKSKGTARRRKIIESFVNCVRRHGYAKTNMAEVAGEAGMLPGHLAYYFSTKEEILRCCYLAQAEIIVQGLVKARDYHGEEKIDYLARFFFTDKEKVDCFTTGLMFEAFGVALNDPELRRCRQLMDESGRGLLESAFRDLLGEGDPSVLEKAEVAYAYLPGLKFSLYFDDDNGLETGRRMFRRMLRLLAGYETM